MSYRWHPVIDTQPSVIEAFQRHFEAVEASTRWEAKKARARAELAFLRKAKAEMAEKGVTQETWPRETTIWERVAESKGYCTNNGVRRRIRNKDVTWDVAEKWISDLYGPEGEAYTATLQQELKEATEAKEAAHKAEEAAMKELEAERQKYSWLADFEEGSNDDVREA